MSRTSITLCADVSRASGEDPIGTAPHWAEVTVLELDVPVWAQLRSVDTWTPAQSAVFAALREKVESSGAGFGLLMSAPLAPGAPLRARHYVRGPGGYCRQDYASDLPQTEWARGLHDTLIEPARLSDWAAVPAPERGADVHVCTHGTVDAACGRYGVPVHAALRDAGERAWRTGHFGGHRFAATAVELPSGLLWAHLTPALAVQVARRELSPAEVAGHLRGFAGLSARAQVLDRALLVQHGWDWLTAQREAQVDGDLVTLTATVAGHTRTYRAAVTDAEPLLLPGSSHKPDRAPVRQYVLGEMEIHPAAPQALPLL